MSEGKPRNVKNEKVKKTDRLKEKGKMKNVRLKVETEDNHVKFWSVPKIRVDSSGHSTHTPPICTPSS